MNKPLEPPAVWVSDVLINLADYHNGAAFSDRHWAKDGLPIIRIENINNEDSEPDRYQGPVLNKNYIDTGDLIFSWSATLKVVIWDRGPAVLNQHLYKVVPKEIIQRDLLFQILNFNMGRLASQSQGSTMKHVTRKELSKFKVVYPVGVHYQQKIARILKTIDRAIEKTEALIEKYQQVKAGLMYDLFTRGIGPDGQLRPPREQAPELYHETPIGWFPKEWDCNSFKWGLSAAPKNGYSPKEVDAWQGVCALGLGCLTKYGFRPWQIKNAPVSLLGHSALLQDGDFLISRANTPGLVGLCGLYRDVGYPAIYPDLMMRLRLNDRLNASFLEKYLLSPFVRQRVSAIAVGTSESMVKINSKNLKELMLIFPSIDEQARIVKGLEPVEKQISSLESQLSKLIKQKSGLMHDLLTGIVQVNSD